MLKINVDNKDIDFCTDKNSYLISGVIYMKDDWIFNEVGIPSTWVIDYQTR